MTDTPPADVATTAAVIAVEIFTDPTAPPLIEEISAEVRFDGDAWDAVDDDGRYATPGYPTREDALRALLGAHLSATIRQTRPRRPDPR